VTVPASALVTENADKERFDPMTLRYCGDVGVAVLTTGGSRDVIFTVTGVEIVGVVVMVAVTVNAVEAKYVAAGMVSTPVDALIVAPLMLVLSDHVMGEASVSEFVKLIVALPAVVFTFWAVLGETTGAFGVLILMTRDPKTVPNRVLVAVIVKLVAAK